MNSSGPADKIIQLYISSDQVGSRIDTYLGQHPDIQSRSRASKLIDLGLVRLNGRSAKGSERLQVNDRIEVSLPQKSSSAHTIPAYELDIEVIYEDEDLAVVNKPSGLVVHPSAGHENDTLVNVLVHRLNQLSMGFAEGRPGIVHRLDKETSGLLVVAKNDAAQHHLAHQFKERLVHRVYWAIVFGCPAQRQGRITSYLRRHPTDRLKFASERLHPDATPKGKFAATRYEVVATSSQPLSLLHCRLETGRTHQIRVHMSELGHPIIGDRLYGAGSQLGRIKDPELFRALKNMDRIGLHAAEIGFTHPRTLEALKFKAEWPLNLKPFSELFDV